MSPQESWQEIAALAREQLEMKTRRMFELGCGECYDLIRTLREAIAFEASAQAFEELIDKHKRTWETP